MSRLPSIPSGAEPIEEWSGDVRALVGKVEPTVEGVPVVAFDEGRGLWLDLVTGEERTSWEEFFPDAR